MLKLVEWFLFVCPQVYLANNQAQIRYFPLSYRAFPYVNSSYSGNINCITAFLNHNYDATHGTNVLDENIKQICSDLSLKAVSETAIHKR